MLAYGAHLILGQALDGHGPGQPLDLARAGAGGVHLGHGGHDGPVDALVALYHVVREEAAGPQLGHPERQRAHARGQLPLPVAVPAVAGGLAELVDLALMTSFTIDSTSERMSSCMFTKPSSNLGMASTASGTVTSAMLSMRSLPFSRI